MAYRSADDAFEDPLLLGRPGCGERIACVEMCVAENQIPLSFVLLPARLGQNFDPTAPGPRVFGGVWVLVDFDLLNGGCAHPQRAHFHSVDDDCRTAGADRPRVEESRDGRNVILIE